MAFFPLIIVMTRIATEITCKSFIEKQTPRVGSREANEKKRESF